MIDQRRVRFHRRRRRRHGSLTNITKHFRTTFSSIEKIRCVALRKTCKLQIFLLIFQRQQKKNSQRTLTHRFQHIRNHHLSYFDSWHDDNNKNHQEIFLDKLMLMNNIYNDISSRYVDRRFEAKDNQNGKR